MLLSIGSITVLLTLYDYYMESSTGIILLLLYRPELCL